MIVSHFVIVVFVVMVVKTRSYKRQVAATAATEAVARSDGRSHRHSRRVKILTTPSFLDSSTRTYKIYSPVAKPPSSRAVVTAVPEDEECVATEALVELQDDVVVDRRPQFVGCICLNPMRPITQYMYCINVYNIDRTLHYRSAYIIYDKTSRFYHVYSIISNCFPETADDATTATTASGYPAPVNTVQMKYTTYANESVVNYIMMMMVPSNEYDYFIQDDIVGITASKEEFAQTAFDSESSYYDINHLFHDNTSSDTVNGFKAFNLIPSRNYWRDPTSTIGPTYTESVINSVLLIL